MDGKSSGHRLNQFPRLPYHGRNNSRGKPSGHGPNQVPPPSLPLRHSVPPFGASLCPAPLSFSFLPCHSGRSEESQPYDLPAPTGIQSLFPIRHALVLVPGRPGAGDPVPFLWIPAKNCGNDRGQAGMTGVACGHDRVGRGQEGWGGRRRNDGVGSLPTPGPAFQGQASVPPLYRSLPHSHFPFLHVVSVSLSRDSSLRPSRLRASSE